ncbi:GNAT family N-acetyltransferase [Algiphilus sp.]|uniref:GNAT family N-acetyltransferase n=1 Tax=Algiphilus sp. TaxID=1872431 RepID=UPI0032F04C9E
MPVASPRIRPLRAADAEPLWMIFHRAVHLRARREYSAAQCAVWAPPVRSAEARTRWRHRLLRNQPVVVEWEGVPVGFADVQANGYIDQFFVDPEVTGLGLADRLMRHLLATARARGPDVLYADVSLSAEAFFRRHGFVMVFRQVVWRDAMAFKNARMHRRLDRPRVCAEPPAATR